MSKLNTTTRCYPRTMEEAFPNNVEAIRQREQGEWMEHYQPNNEQWLNTFYAFSAGFIVSMLIFVK